MYQTLTEVEATGCLDVDGFDVVSSGVYDTLPSMILVIVVSIQWVLP